MAAPLLLEGERQPIVNRPGASWPTVSRVQQTKRRSELDEKHNHRLCHHDQWFA